jgi:hypothetical protein
MLVALTRTTLKRMRCTVKLQGHLSNPLFTQKDLRQKDALACLLFNIPLEKVTQDLAVERGTIFHKTVQILAHADDADVTGRSERSIKEAFIRLDTETQLMGLKVNENKTKCICRPINITIFRSG